MSVLGHCRHRFGHEDYCGLTVLLTAYGPGHASPPRFAHYPVITTGSSEAGTAGLTVAAGRGPLPGERRPAVKAALTGG